MTTRFTNLDRTLTLVRALCESVEGMTLDEMAALLGVNRRTVERMRDVILIHFDLEESVDGRGKRFRIRESLSRAYTRPTAVEISALEALVEAARREGTAYTKALESLLGKIKASLEASERRRVDNDLELLTRLQRARVFAGPIVVAAAADLTSIQSAILAGRCIEFDYCPEGVATSGWRRVIPYGLIHGPVTYLIGKMPGRDEPPATYRLDRMSNVHTSSQRGCPPSDWDLDTWLERSFGMWDEEAHDVVLRVRSSAVPKAKDWRFHPRQQLELVGDELLVRFRAGGLREIAEHLFAWGGEVVIEAPTALKETMKKLLAAQSENCGGVN